MVLEVKLNNFVSFSYLKTFYKQNSNLILKLQGENKIIFIESCSPINLIEISTFSKVKYAKNNNSNFSLRIRNCSLKTHNF